MSKTPSRSSRVDEDGLAYAGSMLQTQLYVNDHAAELNAAILEGLPDLAKLNPEIRWVSPLRDAGYREYWDRRFLRELSLEEFAGSLAEWWPSGGPHWDALARLKFSDSTVGALLVEGKSYPKEMRDGNGATATSQTSIAKIEAALTQTQDWLGVIKPVEAWLRPYYQTANRLASLYWLHRQLGGNGAWLVHLCFLNDPTHVRSTRAEWEVAFAEANEHLGLTNPVPNYAHVFIDGLARPAAVG